MRSMLAIVGIILIIAGIASLGYSGFTYTKREKIAEIGPVQVTADTEKNVKFPPIAGGLAVVAGIILVLSSRK